ncbi:MAG: hypothetical protein ACFFCP_06545 [Promethearchaeota archaeon]
MQKDDSTIEEFIDIRRKVGNQIIRKYLLNAMIESNRIERVSGKLRGPKNQFKDFAKFLILRVSIDGTQTKFLAESGVYENLRIVAISPNVAAEKTADELIRLFTNALEHPESYDSILVLSEDSKIQ